MRQFVETMSNVEGAVVEDEEVKFDPEVFLSILRGEGMGGGACDDDDDDDEGSSFYDMSGDDDDDATTTTRTRTRGTTRGTTRETTMSTGEMGRKNTMRMVRR